jgi:hypothetical protein
LAFLDLDVLDFTWVAIFVTRAYNNANLAFMALVWPEVGLVIDPLLVALLPFFPRTLAFVNIRNMKLALL